MSARLNDYKWGENTSVWINRAGQSNSLEFRDLFLKENIIAIDWADIKENLTNIDNKEKLRKIFMKSYPKHIYEQENPGKNYKGCVGNSVGQIWSFLKEMKKGDIVLIPIENNKLVVAEIVGDYEWVDEIPRHRRKIKIIERIPEYYYLKRTGSKGLYSGTVARLRYKDNNKRKYLSNEKYWI
ncbi:restriction endonuclease [Methanothermococcus okinawensis]|uniref:Uncharacterized protein n=1 Tax=Methanothermococcus okinawensis (strain DSM 14208 / JCM 11175 / IH1) TaxID=647113 RepID=F8ANE5_METOI|nr:hypothetical protein [Methanothermococcus okinawensis]AEH06206.1 hypothetical protein Metok_0213 [Methanothermococcus okinawensis IH1]